MGDPSFKMHFRMTRTTFEVLVEVIGNHLVATNRLRRARTPIPLILMMVLWILATPDTFRSVALQFDTRPGTVHFHYLYILECLVEIAPRYITWPTAAERQETKEFFERRTGFPGVIGCIDGTHHYITAPRYDKIRYVNRHDKYSVNTQVVCDHRLLIRDIKVGEVGSKHDSRIFRESPLCRRLLEDENAIAFDEHILGDGGYLLTSFLITPFRNNGHLTAEQRNYNRIHALLRNRIENCHCLSKGMWRRTKFIHAMHPEIVVNHILASACLHNFVILNGEETMELQRGLAVPLDEEEIANDVDNLVVPEAEDVEYPNIPGQFDHPGLPVARQLGVEKRAHVMRVLPRLFA